MPPIETVQQVELDRFMGDWYVIAHIPVFIEADAYDAVESYERSKEGRIETTYRFRKGGFDGPTKEYHPVAFVSDESEAVWSMRFVWPFTTEYRIIYLDPDYGVTVIGRTKRDYVWIMSREPSIAEEKMAEIKAFLIEQGYDLSELRQVPHSGAESETVD